MESMSEIYIRKGRLLLSRANEISIISYNVRLSDLYTQKKESVAKFERSEVMYFILIQIRLNLHIRNASHLPYVKLRVKCNIHVVALL